MPVIGDEVLSQQMQSLDMNEKESIHENEELASILPENRNVNSSKCNEGELNDTGYYEKQSEYDYDLQHEQQFFRNTQNLLAEQHSPCVSPNGIYNKRQTGKKNISHIVVGTDDKIEFDQVDDKGFGVVKINRPIGVSSRSSTHENLNDNESVHSHESERTHTAEGYFDLKFFSHRLW